MATYVLKHPATIEEQLEAQTQDDTLAQRVSATEASLKQLRREEGKLAAFLGQVEDPSPILKRLNDLSAARTSLEKEVAELHFQLSHAKDMAKRLNGFHQRWLDIYNRVDAMSYDERRTVLRDFSVQVTLWKKDHDPRYTIDWAYDLGEDWWQPDLGEGDYSWVEYTGAMPDLLFNSSA